MSNMTEVRPFSVDVPEEELVDLRRRVAATRWPDPETVSDRSQGVRLEKLQERRGRCPNSAHCSRSMPAC